MESSIVPSKAQTPVIVSASRSTDIPAFYADWFFDRLEKGYSAWTNPFNGVKSYVSFEKTRFIVFWSKNPRPLIPFLPRLKEMGIDFYIQFTLNDYDKEHLEPGVPNVESRIATFKELVDTFGKGRVVWRFDPLLLTSEIGIDSLLEKLNRIGDELKGYSDKLVFSYADIATYKKVKLNLDRSGIKYREWKEEDMELLANGLHELNRKWGYVIGTCGEKIDLGKYGIIHNKCVDDDLIIRLDYCDETLMRYLGVEIVDRGGSLFGDDPIPQDAVLINEYLYAVKNKNNKDKGQRKFCGCISSKDIGQYNTCPHLCEYCYANSSRELAISNWKMHKTNPFAETITGK